MNQGIKIFLIRFENNCYRLNTDTTETPVIYVDKKKSFHIIKSHPYNDSIRCDLIDCGCRLNSFIWINHSRKLIYFENPKSGSSSIKKSLKIKHPDLINVLIQLYLEWNKAKMFDILIKDFNVELTQEYLDDCIKRVNELLKYQVKRFHNKLFITQYADSYQFELFYGTTDDVFELFPDYYSFSFKRDPVDRFLSNYRMFKQHENRLIQLKTITKSKHDDLNLTDFIQIAQKFSNHHWLPQIKYIPISSGKIKLDFLRDIKTFDSDWNYLTKQFGLSTTLERINYTDLEEPEIISIDDEKLITIRNMYSEDYNILEIL